MKAENQISLCSLAHPSFRLQKFRVQFLLQNSGVLFLHLAAASLTSTHQDVKGILALPGVIVLWGQ